MSDTYEAGQAPEPRRAGWVRLSRALALAGRHERTLWVVVACALVGDVVLTAYGLSQGLTEANPIVAAAIAEIGFAALGVVKLGAIGFGIAAWLAMPTRLRVVVPIGLSLPWIAATAINTAVIFG